jgi:hypothetical protein
MFGLTKDQILGLFRHVVTFAGGILVARGKLDPAAVESIVGALVTLVGVFFSMASPEKTAPPIDTTQSTQAGGPLVDNPGAKITLPPGA